ncbi:hypothetical protein DRQ21_10565 [Candidatus Fermentibacteria bacterium]|nr:MAG: hypothetical protein DRQ21_10565 [Candidatus Fermentibacteria bacterium]
MSNLKKSGRCQLVAELLEWKKFVIGRESREKLWQIRNYEIRHKTSDECEIQYLRLILRNAQLKLIHKTNQD